MSINFNLLKENVKRYSKKIDAKLNYAVSGLRNKSSILECPVFRTGIIACLRSIQQNGSAIGLMITASHNPADDNGVKIIDPKGEMLDKEWVKLANEFINLNDDELEDWLNSKFKELDVKQNGLVFIAKDTRDSSDRLAEAASNGILTLLNSQFKDFGYLTTPQLHFIVNCQNTNGSYGQPSEVGYYLKYSKSFLNLTKILKSTLKYEKNLTIDCANGVGSLKMNLMNNYLKNQDLEINLINVGDGILNLDCGADYVKIEQRPPKNLQLEPGLKYASFDGDADRLVYFYFNLDTNSFKLLDGDKIACLFAIYINKILKKLNLDEDLDVSLVQTAYANGNSTNYIEQVLGMKTYCVATGVLNLHRKASECDIGIYFEANGHGTILFSNKLISILNGLKSNENAKELLLFIDLINQTAGDAISDLLATEFILRQLDWSIHQWSEIYTDLPQRQLKLKVKDRTKIKISEDERKCIDPIELQNEIDILVNEFGENSRSFVRPSGTEDIVRVYAESSTQELANQLAEKVAEKVSELIF